MMDMLSLVNRTGSEPLIFPLVSHSLLRLCLALGGAAETPKAQKGNPEAREALASWALANWHPKRNRY